MDREIDSISLRQIKTENQKEDIETEIERFEEVRTIKAGNSQKRGNQKAAMRAEDPSL